MIYIGKNEYRYKSMLMSHMTADTLLELHTMAKNIGINKRYFQNKNGQPLYGICKSRKNIALKLGAIEVNDKDLFLMSGNKTQRIQNKPNMTEQEKKLLIMIYELLPEYWAIWVNKFDSWSLGEIVEEYNDSEMITKTFEDGSLYMPEFLLQRFSVSKNFFSSTKVSFNCV